MYKIVPIARQGCSKGMITKNRCKPSKNGLQRSFLAPPARLELTTFRLGGGPSILVRYGGIYRNYSVIQGSGIRTVRLLGGDRSIQLSYGGLYRKYSILQGSRIRTIRLLGGGPSIPVRYGGIYRKYSILQGSGVRTDRLLGGGRSIQLSYGGIWVSVLWCRRMGTVSFYPVPGCLSTVEMTEAGRAA